MKFLTFLLTLLLPALLLAKEIEVETDWTLEVRGAFYLPSGKTARRIYSDGWLDYQVEASKKVSDFWEVWGGVNWMHKRGHAQPASHGFKDHTRISILPLSLGAKFIYPVLPCVEAYFGVGVCYSFLRIKNHCYERYRYWGLDRSPFKRSFYKSDVGAVIKLGFQYAMSSTTYLDFFADYFSQRFHFSRNEDRKNRSPIKHEFDCSGFKFGAGFGVYF